MTLRERRVARRVKVGSLSLGGGEPVRVQSMTNTPSADVEATLNQINILRDAGCELVRVAVSSRKEISAFGAIRQGTNLPLIADIQYNHRFAISCIDLGADKVRINPGNIGSESHFAAVLEAAGKRGKAVRIGINSGSLEGDILEKHGRPTPQAMLESALRAIEVARRVGFDQLLISMKSSEVLPTIEAYRLIAEETDFPLHLGITEAGGVLSGGVKSAVGIGIVLHEGLGDTIRVSLSGSPEAEVRVAYQILRALSLRHRGPEIISCPTCSRCQIDIISMVEEVERRLTHLTSPLTVAVMGCYVNGPGEARMADVGLAGGAGKGALFKKGVIVRHVPEEGCLEALMEEIEKIVRE